MERQPTKDEASLHGGTQPQRTRSESFAPLQIKTERGAVFLVPDPGLAFGQISESLKARLETSNGFFKNARVVYDLRSRPFRADEVRALRTILQESANADLAQVRLGAEIQGLLNWASHSLGVTVHADVKSVPAVPQPVIVSQTCRSGMRIESEAECIVYGDVNPGAEVIAAGNIIILGRLRGMAHAGCHGNRDARIWALSFEPNQIRIADLIAQPPAEDGLKAARMEMAHIQDDRICVTAL